MMPDAHAAIDALVEAVAQRERGDAAQPDIARRFVMDSLAGMPGYLRPPLHLATLAFDAWPLIRRGRPFHRLRHEERLRQVEAWERSALGPCRMLMTLYVSLTLFGLWPDHQEEKADQREDRRYG